MWIFSLIRIEETIEFYFKKLSLDHLLTDRVMRDSVVGRVTLQVHPLIIKHQ